MIRAVSIDGLEQVEFNYEYKDNHDEVVFARSFPVLSYCFINGCAIEFSSEGVRASNSGGCFKRNTTKFTSDQNLDVFLNNEEIEIGTMYNECYPKNRLSVFGEAEVVDEEAPLPTPPLYAFSATFPLVTAALKHGGALFLDASLHEKPCVLRRSKIGDVYVSNKSKIPITLKGALTRLEEELANQNQQP